MASEIRVNTINNRSGLGTITISDTGAVFAGVTTITSLQVTGTLIGVANTDNIRTNTNATFLQNVNVSGAVTSTGMIVTGVTTVAAGSTSVPSISPSGDTNTGIFFPSADTIAFGEGGTESARIDSSGRLGIGTASPVQTLDVNGGIGVNGAITCKSSGTARGYLGDVDGDTHMQIRSESGQISFKKANTEFARFDTSSRFLVGTSSAVSGGEPSNALLQVQGRNGGAGEEARIAFARGEAATSITNNEPIGTIYFCDNGGNTFADIRCSADGTAGTNDYPGKLVFSTTADGAASPSTRLTINNSGQVIFAQGAAKAAVTSYSGESAVVHHYEASSGLASASERTLDISAAGDGTKGGNIRFFTNPNGTAGTTERMRINNKGYFKATATGNYYGVSVDYHELRTANSDWATVFSNSHASNPYGIVVAYTAATPNGTDNYFFYAADGTTLRAQIRSNGGLANYSANNANLSDINSKKDISPAADTWDCIKEWEIVNYRYKDQPDDADLNLGVIAQQVAESCPEVITVFEEAKDDQPEKLGIKEQQMYWMAIKALQEAQERIETLETEKTTQQALINDLITRVAALEAQ